MPNYTPTYTPAFQMSTKLVAELGKKEAIQQLFFQANRLKVDEISKRLEGIFEDVANRANSKKIELFLNDVSRLLNKKDPSIALKLEDIRKLDDEAKKEEALKKLFLDEKLRNLFAQGLKQERHLSLTPQEKVDYLSEENSTLRQKDAKDRADQDKYGSLDTFVVRGAIQLIFSLIDLVLSYSGQDAQFSINTNRESAEESDKIKFLPMAAPAPRPS